MKNEKKLQMMIFMQLIKQTKMNTDCVFFLQITLLLLHILSFWSLRRKPRPRSLPFFFFFLPELQLPHSFTFCSQIPSPRFFSAFPLHLKLSKSCVNVSRGPGCPRQANHKHTGKKIVMVCTLQSSPAPRGQVDSGFFQSTMKIQRGQASRHVFHSLLWWDEQG